MASYEKRPGGWTVRFRWIEDGTEKQIRLSGNATKKAAQEAYELYKLEHTQIHRQAAYDSPATLLELCEAYVRDSAGTVKKSSLYEVESRLRNHVLPELGPVRLEDLTPLMLLRWQNKMMKDYARNFVLSCRYALSAAWSYGATFHGLPPCPLDKVKTPRDDSIKAELSVWSREEYAAFREALRGPQERLLFDTLIYTGCRKGEALALSAADVEGDSISITKSVTRKSERAWEVTAPKTKCSTRTVSIPHELAVRLRESEGRFIFGGAAPYADRTVDRWFTRAIEASGVPRIRIHDLRHTHASWLISEGCSIVAVSKRLGHSSTKQTLDTYAHFLPKDEDDISRKLVTFWAQNSDT